MILAGSIAAAIGACWALFAFWLSKRQAISMRQALLLAPLAAIWRLDARRLRGRSDATSAIYVVTHQSRLDPAIMLSQLPSDTLHILEADDAGSPWLEPWRELARTITFNPEHVFVSRRLVRLLRGGARICVYLPADVEPDVRTYRLYRAVARIALRAGAKVVPVHIEGSGRLPLSILPPAFSRGLFPKLRISALDPMTIGELLARAGPAAQRPSDALFDRVAEARVAATLGTGRTLFQALAVAARNNGLRRPIVEDALGARMSYFQLMVSARIVARRLHEAGLGGDAVGVLLPNAVPVASLFFGLQSAGRIAAMLNYTAGPQAMAAAARTAELRLVVSSRAFVEKAQLHDEIAALEAGGTSLLYLEDMRADVGRAEKAFAALTCLRPLRPAKADDPAVMLFTSGSEGEPKGVVLSHRNLLANVAQVETRIAFSPDDTLFNVLPVFHAFGLTGGMVLPLLGGVRLHLYPSPLHYKQIPETAARVKPSILFGTDTFLAAYVRAAADGDFDSLRLIVAGAEPVRPATRKAWHDRFGTRIVEGYGMTEASPVVAVNSATHGRDGTVGRLLPDMRARLDPVEGIPNGGRLRIAGPNVMLGYRLAEDPRETIAPPDGWHDTGDVVIFDKDGFISIVGRVKRFAKVAGEMVSLSAVEMLAHSLWPDDRHAAVALPDERKGERVVLVSTGPGDRNALRAHVRKTGAQDLALPAAIVVVEDLPMLGTGKPDHARVAAIAAEASGTDKAA